MCHFSELPNDFGSHTSFELGIISAAAFRDFLNFLYLEEVILIVENIGAVLNLAKQLLVDALVTEWINFTMAEVTIDNLC